MDTLGERVKSLRKVKGLSQRDLAKLIGTSAGLISFIERNKNKPNYDIIRKLSIVLDTSTDYLINGVHSAGSLKKALEDLKQPFYVNSENIKNLSESELSLLEKHNVLARLSKLNKVDLKILLGILKRMENKTGNN